jgi:hypothetical protein
VLTGAYDDALRDFERAALVDPPSLDPVLRLTFLYATCPDDSIRSPENADRLSQAMLDAAPANPFVLSARACALATMGEFAAAIELERKALAHENFARDPQPSGGQFSGNRIEHWQQQKLWLLKPPQLHKNR